MITVKQATIQCDFCGTLDHMRLDWSNFRIPDGWRYRTRSWNDDHIPEEVQIQCKGCASK